MRALSEQTILVTGATDGLGQALAMELARQRATVLVHGRDPHRLAATLDRIRAEAGNPRVREYRADFASLADVHALGAQILADEPRLDALVNNAGIGTTVPGGGARQESRDGIELRFAVNYLAGYTLTRLLLPLLRASAPARIVYVSSAGQAPLDFDDLMLTHRYSGTTAYCQSKLAQIMDALSLAEQLERREVTVNALHPATYMPTKIVPAPVSSLRDGVDATLRLLTDPDLAATTGRYYNRHQEARAHPQAYDADARRQLADISQRLAGLPRAA